MATIVMADRTMSRDARASSDTVPTNTRRHCLKQIAGLFGLALWSNTSFALMPDSAGLASADKRTLLSSAQAQAFRSWFQLIVLQQLKLGPTPRWKQRDCAGLVRFASAEALRIHDNKWLKANGFLAKKIPPELNLTAPQLEDLRHAWLRADGSQGAFVTALELVQHNTRPIGKEMAHAEVADLLLFDQGQAQHLMIWLGKYVAYHTGTVTPEDNGLRAYPLSKLMTWDDTRWQPHVSNPNFIGIFRMFFLRAS